jgi:hypothetical protein
MLDPNHNAHADYYLVDGDFTGSWNWMPKDLVIVCWYYQKRNESLKFFSSLGFPPSCFRKKAGGAGAYYDGDTLDPTSCCRKTAVGAAVETESQNSKLKTME